MGKFKGDYRRLQLGGIYDINDRQSIGAEVAFLRKGEDKDMNSVTAMANSQMRVDTSGYYMPETGDRFTAAMNYQLKLDTLGSEFKVIVDYSSQKTDNTGSYLTNSHYYELPSMAFLYSRDSVYRSSVANDYNVLSVAASLDMRLSDKSMFKTGLKFTNNDMRDDAVYEVLNPSSEWIMNQNQSILQSFDERIGAVYGIFNSKFGKVSYSLGLRGEYTYASPRTTVYDGQGTLRTRQNYFDLFPNLNISLPVNGAGDNSLIFAYNRKISRPSFWSLNPFKVKTSEYTYITGDPNLKPSYSHDVSLAFVFKHKYTLTAGTTIRTNVIRQIVFVDDQEPDMITYRQANMDRDKSLYLALNAPVTLTKWLTLNVNANVSRYNQNPFPDRDYETTHTDFNAHAAANFTLPKKFSAEAVYYYWSGGSYGNMKTESQYNVNLHVRKRFFNDKLTVSIDARNIIPDANMTKLSVEDPDFAKYTTQAGGWTRTRFGFSVRYNFRAGIKFNTRNIERTGDDSRM